LDANKVVISSTKYNDRGLLTDFSSEYFVIKYTYDSINCDYTEDYIMKTSGIFEPEGEIGSISGRECICKEYSRKGLLSEHTIERNSYVQKWLYEYYDNDLIKSEKYYINGKLIYRHLYIYEYY